MSLRTFLAKVDNKDIRRGLYFSNLDGIVWAVMFGLAENFIVPFALLFGASVLQVSLITGFGQLGVGISQLAGARFVNWLKKRKILSTVCEIIHALSWLLMFIFTALTGNPWFVVDDLAILQLENIDDGVAAAARRGDIVDVQDHIIAVGENTFDVAVIIGKFLAQEGEKGFQAFRPIGGPGIVLGVA